MSQRELVHPPRLASTPLHATALFFISTFQLCFSAGGLKHRANYQWGLFWSTDFLFFLKNKILFHLDCNFWPTRKFFNLLLHTIENRIFLNIQKMTFASLLFCCISLKSHFTLKKNSADILICHASLYLFPLISWGIKVSGGETTSPTSHICNAKQTQLHHRPENSQRWDLRWPTSRIRQQHHISLITKFRFADLRCAFVFCIS